ncbi:glycosyltransferase [Candidatus Bathyarchaeota archaeon]|nr:glycosyltransferase [Candidatus Bathyarchaeota archaeon]
MDMPKVTLVTTNFNSERMMPLAKLSLLSAFLIEYENMEVILVDSASIDNSPNELANLGSFLSEKTGKPFYLYKLRKDFGNTYAIDYGWQKAREHGAKYVVLMDNDFVITNFEILKKLVHIAENIYDKIYSIAPVPLWCLRENGIEKALHILKEISLNHKKHMISRELFENECAYTEHYIVWDLVNLVDAYGNIASPFNKCFMTLNSYDRLRKVLRYNITPVAFTCSCFSLYRSDLPSFFPFFILYYDDVCSGFIENLKKHLSLYYAEIGGVHYAISKTKSSSPITTFLNSRSEALYKLNTIGFKAFLNLAVKLLYFILKKQILSPIISRNYSKKYGGTILNELAETTFNRRVAFQTTKYSILGVYYGFKVYLKYKKLFKQWYNIKGSEKNRVYMGFSDVLKYEKSLLRKLLILLLSPMYASDETIKKYIANNFLKNSNRNLQISSRQFIPATNKSMSKTTKNIKLTSIMES